MKFVFDKRSAESSLVETVYYTQSEGTGSFISRAGSQWEMVVTRSEGKTSLTVRGPETKARPAPIPADAEFLGIVFKLGAFMPQLPVSEFVNREINLPQASDNKFWLHGSSWQFPKFENADVFINRLVQDDLLVYEPVIGEVLQDQPLDLSARTLQRRFLQATGLTHKIIQQIERAQQAATLLEQGVPILDVVFETGYFDQPHLTKSLKRFVGQTPSQIVETEQAE